MESSRKLSVAHLVVVMLVIVALQAIFFAPHTAVLSYSDFKKLVQAGKVTDLVVEQTIRREILRESEAVYSEKGHV